MNKTQDLDIMMVRAKMYVDEEMKQFQMAWFAEDPTVDDSVPTEPQMEE